MVLIRFGRVEGIAAELALDYHLLVPLTHVPIVLRFDGLFHCGGLHFFCFIWNYFSKTINVFVITLESWITGVSTILSGMIFEVEKSSWLYCQAFSYYVIVVQKMFQSRRKVNFQGVGLLLSSHSFTKNIHWQQHNMSRSCDPWVSLDFPISFDCILSDTHHFLKRKPYIAQPTRL